MKLKLMIPGVLFLILGTVSYICGFFSHMNKDYFSLASYILLLGAVVVGIIACIRKLFCFSNKEMKKQVNAEEQLEANKDNG